jgi:sigma-B regulation protein RsbU (phosphoserine phosphatase)
MPLASAPTSSAPNTASNLINLQSLIDLSAALNASDEEQFILNTALLSVMGKLRTFKACALVPCAADTAGGSNAAQMAYSHWFCAASKGLPMPNEPFALDCGAVLQNPQAEPTLAASRVQILQPVMTHGIRSVATASTTTLQRSANLVSVAVETDGEAEQCLALLCFGDKMDKTPYTDEERQYLSLVGSITANALVNAANMRSLRETGAFLERKNQLLTTLFEINREFSSLLDKEEILKFLSLRLMGQLTVTRFSLLIKTTNSDGRGGFDLALNRLQLTPDHVAAINERAERADRVRDVVSACNGVVEACALIVPMTVQNETKGLLLIGGKMNKQAFSAEEEKFLEALASTAMTALENARLFHEELEKKRLEEELNLARQIQTGLLPTDLPQIQGYEIAAVNLSSKQIGGDYYDVIPVVTNHTASLVSLEHSAASQTEYIVVIADVSGKGTPAALLMANTQAALRAFAPLRLPLPEMVSRLNDLLYANTSSDKFVTLFCAKLNPVQGTLTFTNAGHNPPMLLHADGTMELLSAGGLVLGIMETLVPYEEETVQLRAGDVLLMYTDGVSEALDVQSQEFSEARTEQSLRKARHSTAHDIVAAIFSDVQSHATGAPQSDDITMIVLKCHHPTPETL